MILQPDMSTEESAALCQRVRSLHYINSLNFVSKEEALKEGTRELGANPAEFAGENPFTGEIELQLKANYANNDSIKTIAQELRTYRGVSDITYPQNLVESVNNTLAKISLVWAFLLVLILCQPMVRYAPSIAFIANVDLTRIIERRRPTLPVNLLLRHWRTNSKR